MKIRLLALFLSLTLSFTARNFIVKAYLKPVALLQQTQENGNLDSGGTNYANNQREEASWNCLFYCGKTETPTKESLCPSTTITIPIPSDLKFDSDQQVLTRCADTNSDEYRSAKDFCYDNGKRCSAPNPDNIVVLGDQ